MALPVPPSGHNQDVQRQIDEWLGSNPDASFQDFNNVLAGISSQYEGGINYGYNHDTGLLNWHGGDYKVDRFRRAPSLQLQYQGASVPVEDRSYLYGNIGSFRPIEETSGMGDSFERRQVGTAYDNSTVYAPEQGQQAQDMVHAILGRYAPNADPQRLDAAAMRTLQQHIDRYGVGYQHNSNPSNIAAGILQAYDPAAYQRYLADDQRNADLAQSNRFMQQAEAARNAASDADDRQFYGDFIKGAALLAGTAYGANALLGASSSAAATTATAATSAAAEAAATYSTFEALGTKSFSDVILTGAAKGAASNAAVALATGQDPLKAAAKGALLGAAGGGLEATGALDKVSETITKAVGATSPAAIEAIKTGVNAGALAGAVTAVSGGSFSDVLKSTAASGLGGAAGSYASNVVGGMVAKDNPIRNTITGATGGLVQGVINSGVQGNSMKDGAKIGLIGGAAAGAAADLGAPKDLAKTVGTVASTKTAENIAKAKAPVQPQPQPTKTVAKAGGSVKFGSKRPQYKALKRDSMNWGSRTRAMRG